MPIVGMTYALDLAPGLLIPPGLGSRRLRLFEQAAFFLLKSIVINLPKLIEACAALAV